MTRSTIIYVIHKLTIDEFADCTNTPMTCSGKIFKVQNVEITNVTLPHQLRGQSVITRLILHMANQYTKFEVSSLSRPRDISSAVKF